MSSDYRVYFGAIYVKTIGSNILFEIRPDGSKAVGQYFTALTSKTIPEKDYARILAKVHHFI